MLSFILLFLLSAQFEKSPTWYIEKELYISFNNIEEIDEDYFYSQLYRDTINLNRDGKADYIYRIQARDFCGASGNCPYLIYQSIGRDYKQVFYTIAADLKILKTKHGGKYDILAIYHGGINNISYTKHVWNGFGYFPERKVRNVSYKRRYNRMVPRRY